MSTENGKRRPNRKKQNSRFLRNAKGFAKRGIHGRGSQLDEQSVNYFINILDSMKSGFEDVEEKVNMANNVFEQTRDQEVHLASNQIVSKALESLIGFVDGDTLERFFNAFAENFRPVCSDRFASHVLQKMVEIAFLRAINKEDLICENETDPTEAKRSKVDLLSEETYNLNTEYSESHKKNCFLFVERIGKFLLNNLEDFVWDSCANHILRTCILCLAGVYVPKIAFEKGNSEIAKNRKQYNVSEQWIEVMKEFPQRLQMWPQFSDFPYNEHSSALLGVICIALKLSDKHLLKHFGKKILMDAFLKVDQSEEDKKNKTREAEMVDSVEEIQDNDGEQNVSHQSDTDINVPKVFEYQSAIILLETLLSVAGPKLLIQLYAMLFTGRILILAKDPSTNFAVQKLLQNIKEKPDFEQVFIELHEYLEELLRIGHTGVVSALSATCLRLGTKQVQMIVALQKALHVSDTKEKTTLLFHCLVKLKPYEICKDDKSNFVHLQGSLIIQNILHFNKPIFMVNCILETTADVLAAIFNTPNGSHIADAFLQSKFIGEKSREKLIRHLEGYYIDLAVTKFGSRVVENVFAAAQDSHKARIMKELAAKSNLLKGTPFGRLLYNKFRVDTYQLSAAQWKTSLQQKQNKTQDLFKDIIN